MEGISLEVCPQYCQSRVNEQYNDGQQQSFQQEQPTIADQSQQLHCSVRQEGEQHPNGHVYQARGQEPTSTPKQQVNRQHQQQQNQYDSCWNTCPTEQSHLGKQKQQQQNESQQYPRHMLPAAKPSPFLTPSPNLQQNNDGLTQQQERERRHVDSHGCNIPQSNLYSPANVDDWYVMFDAPGASEALTDDYHTRQQQMTPQPPPSGFCGLKCSPSPAAGSNSTASGMGSDTTRQQRQRQRQQQQQQQQQQPPPWGHSGNQSLQYRGAAATGKMKLELQALRGERQQQHQWRQAQEKSQKSLNGAASSTPPLAAFVPQTSWSELGTSGGRGSSASQPSPPEARGLAASFFRFPQSEIFSEAAASAAAGGHSEIARSPSVAIASPISTMSTFTATAAAGRRRCPTPTPASVAGWPPPLGVTMLGTNHEGGGMLPPGVAETEGGARTHAVVVTTAAGPSHETVITQANGSNHHLTGTGSSGGGGGGGVDGEGVLDLAVEMVVNPPVPPPLSAMGIDRSPPLSSEVVNGDEYCSRGLCSSCSSPSCSSPSCSSRYLPRQQHQISRLKVTPSVSPAVTSGLVLDRALMRHALRPQYDSNSTQPNGLDLEGPASGGFIGKSNAVKRRIRDISGQGGAAARIGGTVVPGNSTGVLLLPSQREDECYSPSSEAFRVPTSTSKTEGRRWLPVAAERGHGGCRIVRTQCRRNSFGEGRGGREEERGQRGASVNGDDGDCNVEIDQNNGVDNDDEEDKPTEDGRVNNSYSLISMPHQQAASEVTASIGERRGHPTLSREERLQRNRARNRYHSRKSRERKKMFLEGLKNQAAELGVYRRLVEEASDLVSAHSANIHATFEYASTGFQRFLGIKPEHLEGASLLDLVDPTDKQEVLKALLSCVRHGGIQQVSYRVQNASSSNNSDTKVETFFRIVNERVVAITRLMMGAGVSAVIALPVQRAPMTIIVAPSCHQQQQ